MPRDPRVEYAHPEVLATTEWVAAGPAQVRVIEVDYDSESAYARGHVPGASLVRWRQDINDPLTRDIVSRGGFEKLMSRHGVRPETTVVLYGDFNNWFAAFAFWVFKYYGHQDVRLMDGGRKKWEMEGRDYETAEPSVEPSEYRSPPPDEGLRAYVEDVRRAMGRPDARLVDVRSPPEFSGEVAAPAEYPSEHAQRAGHIPGAENIPWLKAVNDEDGTFRSADELRELYSSRGVTADRDVVCYCRIGERSSHSWFVLKYLLGYPRVRNYDGSWTEWGNMVGSPVEK